MLHEIDLANNKLTGTLEPLQVRASPNPNPDPDPNPNPDPDPNSNPKPNRNLKQRLELTGFDLRGNFLSVTS